MDLVRNIKLSQIQTNPYQPRTVFDQQKLEELAESIKKRRFNPAGSLKKDGFRL